MPMITAPVLNAVQELLHERGISKRNNEGFGDAIARGLGITSAQAEALLAALHEGKTLEEAQLAAGIMPKADQQNFLIDLARVIGAAMGHLSAAVPPSFKA